MPTNRGENYFQALDAVAISPASLATDSNFLAGRQSDEVTFDDCIDASVHVQFTTGTSPTASRWIYLYFIASIDGTTYPDNFGASDAARTISSTANRDANCVPVASWFTSSASDAPYEATVPSLKALCDGQLPQAGVFWVVHNTGVNFNATGGNHTISIVKIQPQFETV